MTRLVPILALFLLAGCDSGGPQADLVGSWRLQAVNTLGGEPIEGPVGSTLQFRGNGTFHLSSANGCSGEFIARPDRMWLVVAACTLIGAELERDLSQMLFLGGDTPAYEITSEGDLYIKVYVTQPGPYLAFYGLRFERE